MFDALRDTLPCTFTIRALRTAMGTPIPVDSGRQSFQAYLTNWTTDSIIGILPLLMEPRHKAGQASSQWTTLVATKRPSGKAMHVQQQ